VKKDVREPVTYAVVLGTLLPVRAATARSDRVLRGVAGQGRALNRAARGTVRRLPLSP